MLGAVNARATVPKVSRPPRQEELTEEGWRDWKTGLELIRTCMETHDTKTCVYLQWPWGVFADMRFSCSGLSPEIVYFRVPSDGIDQYDFAPEDWYIRGAQ